MSRDLGSRAASALRWAASATLISQLATWAMTIIVIRILTPDDYGLMAIGMVFVSFLMLVNELGMGAVLVQKRELDEKTRTSVFTLTLILNGTFGAATLLGAPLIAQFFEEPRLAAILRALSVLFVIYAFEIVPVAHLERELDFRRKSLINLFANVSGGVVTLGSALAGLGVWSLVAGTVWIGLVRTVGFNFVAPYIAMPRLHVKALRESLHFGGLVTLERALWFFYSQIDVFIVGKVLGKTLLGYYSVAMNLASLIMHKSGGVLYEVAFPTFSRVQEERERTLAYFLKAVRVMSFFAFPMFFGISAVGYELVEVLLGEQWEPAAILLVVLSLIMPLRMISNLFPPVLQGLGRPDVSVGNLGVAIVLMPAAFFLGTRWGVVGVAFAWLIAFPLTFVVMFVRSRAVLGVRTREMLSAMLVPALVSAVMYAAVVAVRSVLPVDWPGIVRLATLIAAGGFVYCAILWFRYRALWGEVLALVRR